MRRSIVLLASLALQITLPAQEPVTAALLVRTNSADLAANMVSSFDSEASTPELVEGSHIVLTLDDGGMINAEVKQGAAPFLDLQARPGQLMEIFADKVGQAEQMAQMMGGMAGMQAGLDASDITQVLDGVFSFPRQVDLLHLIVQEDPSTGSNIDASLQLDPQSGSWLGRLVSNAQVHSKGLLSILDPMAMITFESNLDISKLDEALRPFMDFTAKMSAKPGEDLAKMRKLGIDQLSATDGTLSINFNPGQGGMVLLGGLRNTDLYKKFLHEGGLAEYFQILQRKNRMVEYEIEDKAVEHRDVKIMKVIQTMENMGPMGGNPFADADGSMTTLQAVAGESYLMASTGAEIGEMKHLIDSISVGSLKRKTLGPNTLAQAKIHLAELAEFFSQMTGQSLGEDGNTPENLSVLVKKVDGSLRIEVTGK